MHAEVAIGITVVGLEHDVFTLVGQVGEKVNILNIVDFRCHQLIDGPFRILGPYKPMPNLLGMLICLRKQFEREIVHDTDECISIVVQCLSLMRGVGWRVLGIKPLRIFSHQGCRHAFRHVVVSAVSCQLALNSHFEQGHRFTVYFSLGERLSSFTFYNRLNHTFPYKASPCLTHVHKTHLPFVGLASPFVGNQQSTDSYRVDSVLERFEPVARQRDEIGTVSCRCI